MFNNLSHQINANKTTMREHYPTSRKAKIKRTYNCKFGKDVEELKFSHGVGGSDKVINSLWKGSVSL